MPTKLIQELVVNLLFDPSRTHEKLLSQVYEGITPYDQASINTVPNTSKVIGENKIQATVEEE